MTPKSKRMLATIITVAVMTVPLVITIFNIAFIPVLILTSILGKAFLQEMWGLK